MQRPDSDHVLATMPVGFMAVTADWVIAHVNPAAEQSLLLDAGELVGRDYWEAYPANVDNEFGRAYRATQGDGLTRTVEAFYPAPLDRWFAAVLEAYEYATPGTPS